MIEAGAPSTEGVVAVLCMVRVPPGVIMVSPPTTQRNASGAQSEGRAKVEETRKRRGPEHYKSRGPLAKSPGR
jgi:hypothetical protein